MIKVLISDFWHVLLFPSDFQTRGSSNVVSKLFHGKEKSDFFDKFQLNEELVNFYTKQKKEKEIKLAVFSSGTLVKTPEVQPFLTSTFDYIFSTTDIRFEKDNPETFRFLAEQMNVEPSEMIFIDDVGNNLEAAVEAGVVTVHYRNNSQAMNEISEILSR